MLLFIVFILISALLVILDLRMTSKRAKKIILISTVILYAVFAAIRSVSEIPDTHAYVKFFLEQTELEFFAPNKSSFEIGFVYLTRVFTLFTSNYRVYFFGIALIIIGMFAKAFENQKYSLIPIVLFLSFYGIYFSFIILRAGLAITFFVYGVMKCDKSIFKTIVFFILSVLFHISSIVMIFAFLLAVCFRKSKLNYMGVIVLLICLLTVYGSGLTSKMLTVLRDFLNSLNMNNLIIGKATSYLTSYIQNFSFGISKRYALNVIMFIIMLYQANTRHLEFTKKQKIINIYILMGFILESLFGNAVLIGRLTDFSNMLNITSVCFIISNFAVSKTRGISPYIKASEKSMVAQKVMFICGIFVILNLAFIYRIIY